ncbi:MAG: hypothetical protein FRX49_11211 [Trebouxia sp. A1-2]|nr:MAG: hypothetical protein FRX49_11211 [Trebouxia sp. A1-2]
MQRVKVYRLTTEGQWDDKGTGQVSVEYMEQSNTTGLVVISEEQDTRTLLIHEIQTQDIYQRQGDETIITWSDAEIGTDVALSFQEPGGCDAVWEQIVTVQQHNYGKANGSDAHYGNGGENGFLKRPGMVDEFDQQVSTSMDDRLEENGNGAPGLELPAPELKNLAQIAKVLGEPRAREMLPPQMTAEYVRKLLDIFRQCDDLEDEDSLKQLYYILKGVVPITNAEVKKRIHQTYRMGYIKDVILPRVLDDQTFAALQSVMLFNNVEILTKLQHDPSFFPDLFKKLRTTAPKAEGWNDLVKFLQELCGLARHTSPANRADLLGQLVNLGLFEVLTRVLKHGSPGLQLRGTDVMLSAIQHDPAPLRQFMRSQKDHELFHLLVRVLEFGPDQGLQGQVVDIVRMLLDPDSMDQSPEKDPFLELFYDKYVGELINLLIEGAEQNQQHSQEQLDAFRRQEQAAVKGEGAGLGPSSEQQQQELHQKQAEAKATHIGTNTMGMVLDLLCFCVQHHGYRIKSYILKRRLMPKLMKPIHCRERWLVFEAISLPPNLYSDEDGFYYRSITKENLFEPVFSVFLDNGPRYNMLNSSVDYVSTFQELRTKHEQNKEVVPNAFATGPANGVAVQPRWRKDARALEREEEDYFNEEDDDDPRGASTTGKRPSSPELHSDGVGRPFVKMRSASPPAQRLPSKGTSQQVSNRRPDHGSRASLDREGDRGSTGSGSKRPIGPQEAPRDMSKRPKISINTSTFTHQDHARDAAEAKEGAGQGSFWKRR